MVAVAQLVERRVVVSAVEGSSPFGHPFAQNFAGAKSPHPMRAGSVSAKLARWVYIG